MKKQFIILFVCISALVYHVQTKAQAFEGKASKTLSFTLGAAQYFHFGGYYGGFHGSSFGYFYTPALAINANLEYGVHKYVGIAPNIGIATSFYPGVFALHIPIGVQGNFHFYQLIADKTKKDIHSDKLDVYAGINLGGGPDIVFAGGADIGGFFYIGPQVGARYYLKNNLGITAELGYGRTIANFGLCYKLVGKQ